MLLDFQSIAIFWNPKSAYILAWKYIHKFFGIASFKSWSLILLPLSVGFTWWHTSRKYNDLSDCVWLPRLGHNTVLQSPPCSFFNHFILKEARSQKPSPTQRPTWQGTEDSCQQPCACAILEAHPPAPVKLSDECSAANVLTTTSRETLSQRPKRSNTHIPGSRELWGNIWYCCFKLLKLGDNMLPRNR